MPLLGGVLFGLLSQNIINKNTNMLEEYILDDLVDNLQVEIDYQELATLEQEENSK